MEQDAAHRVRNLKNMDDPTWNLAKDAAARADETLGAWLSRAAHQLAQRERGERVLPPGVPVQPANDDDPPAPRDPIDWHGLGTVLAGMAAAGIPVQKRVGRQVNALLHQRLRAALPPPGGRRALAGPPAPPPLPSPALAPPA